VFPWKCNNKLPVHCYPTNIAVVNNIINNENVAMKPQQSIHFNVAFKLQNTLYCWQPYKFSELPMWGAKYFCLILAKLGFSQQSFIKLPSIKFCENPSSWSWIWSWEWQTNRHDKANRHFLRLCKIYLKFTQTGRERERDTHMHTNTHIHAHVRCMHTYIHTQNTENKLDLLLT